MTSLECWPRSNNRGISSHMLIHPFIALQASASASAEFWYVSGAAVMALCLLSPGLFDEIKAHLS